MVLDVHKLLDCVRGFSVKSCPVCMLNTCTIRYTQLYILESDCFPRIVDEVGSHHHHKHIAICFTLVVDSSAHTNHDLH